MSHLKRVRPRQTVPILADPAASGIAARLVVVEMVSNGFSIADRTDPEMLDVVGFDTATPQFISDFARGAL